MSVDRRTQEIMGGGGFGSKFSQSTRGIIGLGQIDILSTGHSGHAHGA